MACPSIPSFKASSLTLSQRVDDDIYLSVLRGKLWEIRAPTTLCIPNMHLFSSSLNTIKLSLITNENITPFLNLSFSQFTEQNKIPYIYRNLIKTKRNPPSLMEKIEFKPKFI